jgi:hypothetical protein
MESISPAMVAQPSVQTHVDLRKAPKWLRKPAGSSFAVSNESIMPFNLIFHLFFCSLVDV